MKLPGIGEQGFTLVELLIVLCVLSILTMVAISNISGIFSRGTEQAYDTDEQTIQQVVALFFYDTRVGPGSGWGLGTAGHYFPTADGKASPLSLAELLAAAGNDPHYFDGGANGAIWMGLLANSPENGTTGNDSPDLAHPQADEGGPYLNEVPESASAHNGNQVHHGSYTWVICRDGKVHGLHWNGFEWKEGFNGGYP